MCEFSEFIDTVVPVKAENLEHRMWNDDVVKKTRDYLTDDAFVLHIQVRQSRRRAALYQTAKFTDMKHTTLLPLTLFLHFVCHQVQAADVFVLPHTAAETHPAQFGPCDSHLETRGTTGFKVLQETKVRSRSGFLCCCRSRSYFWNESYETLVYKFIQSKQVYFA